jgi:hypothetical protein
MAAPRLPSFATAKVSFAERQSDWPAQHRLGLGWIHSVTGLVPFLARALDSTAVAENSTRLTTAVLARY